METKKELIKWSSTFMCGIKIIDEQHKGLVDLVNEMFNHVSKDKLEELEYFNSVINEAVNYIKVHFSTEEKIMSATKFPGHIEHKQEHERFIATVAQSIKDYQSGKHLILAGFTKFLKDWILTHIAIMDKQYFEHCKKIADRKADGTLNIDSEGVINSED